ncbi:MAG TPA: hypothetical protein ENH48_05660 [Halieaceae bacterium]|nr:hypothetical protein [Halieaceae bacterium]
MSHLTPIPRLAGVPLGKMDYMGKMRVSTCPTIVLAGAPPQWLFQRPLEFYQKLGGADRQRGSNSPYSWFSMGSRP